ncbi:uncharacterized protein LOC128198758 isoform X1 [Bicyclus anynana]|uniref:Uncharacterized protein LOC128198758 isoform X1 n=1 Tax=Bicyclus anynana TaxID=110368 RepID=A0ABM3LR49_BICAN|nr:uncharacterized protein LOC128198758 isoform X1 [Bicyclus anynana]
MACLLAYVAEMERAGGGEAGGGRAPVYATVAWASLLAAFSHVYFSTIVVLNNGDESTLVSYVFVYLQTVAKTALALERGALLGALSAALRGVLARLDALGAEVRAHGEAPQRMAAHAAAHAAALATARDVKRAYLRLQRLAARLHSHEGPALLLLLGGSVFRTFVCVYIATSAFYLHAKFTWERSVRLVAMCRREAVGDVAAHPVHGAGVAAAGAAEDGGAAGAGPRRGGRGGGGARGGECGAECGAARRAARRAGGLPGAVRAVRRAPCAARRVRHVALAAGRGECGAEYGECAPCSSCCCCVGRGRLRHLLRRGAPVPPARGSPRVVVCGRDTACTAAGYSDIQ